MARITYKRARIRVDVDETGSEELRELYVDARDLRKDQDDIILSDAAYAAILTQRGQEKLIESRRVEVAEAKTALNLDPGALVSYDAGPWNSTLLCTEATTTREGGSEAYSATLGQGPLSLRGLIRLVVR